MMLLEMPDHILTRIFGLLKVGDRLNLSLVCAQLNHLFSNEKALMKKILVRYESPLEGSSLQKQLFLDAIIGSGRKYRNLEIDLISRRSQELSDEFFVPLTNFQSLTDLKIMYCAIKLKVLAKLINNLPNLEVFTTCCVNLRNTEKSMESIICKKLKKIETDYPIFLQLMETPDLTDLKIEIYVTQREEQKNLELMKLRHKIVNLPKLKCLHLEEPIYFNEVFIQNAKFKLTEVSVNFKDWPNTKTFLMAQNELQKVTIVIDWSVELRIVRDIIEFVLVLPKVKSLTVEMQDFPGPTFDRDFNITPNTRFEALSFEVFSSDMDETESNTTAKFIQKLIPKLPNLKTLHLDIGKGFFGDHLVILNSLKHLKKLSICALDSALLHLNLPILEDFSLEMPFDSHHGYSECIDANLQMFFKNHPHLKKVQFASDKLVSRDVWMFAKQNLHHLEVFQSKLLPSIPSIFEDHLFREPEKYAYFCSNEDFDIVLDKRLATATRIRFN